MGWNWEKIAKKRGEERDDALFTAQTLKDERDALQAELDYIKSRRHEFAQKLENDRAALQARIDAGVRVWSETGGAWYLGTSDVHPDITGLLLIDPQPIAQAWTRADGSTTPRTGERREKGSWKPCECKQPNQGVCRNSKGFCWKPNDDFPHFAKDNRRDPSGANDRRKAAK